MWFLGSLRKDVRALALLGDKRIQRIKLDTLNPKLFSFYCLLPYLLCIKGLSFKDFKVLSWHGLMAEMSNVHVSRMRKMRHKNPTVSLKKKKATMKSSSYNRMHSHFV